MRIRTAALSVALAGILSLLAAGAEAQTTPQPTRTAQASQPIAGEPRAQPPARRPPKRVRIYPRYQEEPGEVDPWYFPGEDAVRECNATYVQEFRPSGAVIVPRMSCHWRRG